MRQPPCKAAASRPEDVARFAQLGIAASVQYTHATSDRDLVERIWADRVEHAYPFRSLWASGARLAGGSDALVEELDPLAGLRATALPTDPQRSPWRPRAGDPGRCCTSLLHRRAGIAEASTSNDADAYAPDADLQSLNYGPDWITASVSVPASVVTLIGEIVTSASDAWSAVSGSRKHAGGRARRRVARWSIGICTRSK